MTPSRNILTRRSSPFNAATVLQAVQLLVGLVLLALAFRSPLADIFRYSVRNPDLGYVWLVPFLALYLAWIRRKGTRVRGSRDTFRLLAKCANEPGFG